MCLRSTHQNRYSETFNKYLKNSKKGVHLLTCARKIFNFIKLIGTTVACHIVVELSHLTTYDISKLMQSFIASESIKI